MQVLTINDRQNAGTDAYATFGGITNIDEITSYNSSGSASRWTDMAAVGVLGRVKAAQERQTAAC